ncbi:hypothetical protein AAOGI_41370 [Agarivorans albus]
MEKKSDYFLSLYVVAFGIPIVLFGKGLFTLGVSTVIVFSVVYFYVPSIGFLRKKCRILDYYVFGSFSLVGLGTWILYDNGFSNSESFWLYFFVVCLGFPVFKKLEKTIKAHQ